MYWDHMNLDLEKGTLYALSTVSLQRYIYDVKGKGEFTLGGESVHFPYTAGDTENAALPRISGDIGHAGVTMEEIID